MRHISDVQYMGHEYIVTETDSGYYNVDIRSDSHSGDIIGAYGGIVNLDDAHMIGQAFIKGYTTGKQEGVNRAITNHLG